MNLAQLYKKQSVATSSPKAIMVLLHDRMLQEILKAKDSLLRNDIETMRGHIEKIQNIASYIMGSTDTTQELGAILYQLYTYYVFRLSDAFVRPSVEILDELHEYFRSWRETWALVNSDLQQNQSDQ